VLVNVGFIVVVTCITPVPLATIPKPTFESVPVAVIVGSLPVAALVTSN